MSEVSAGDVDPHRQFAVQFNGRAWELLGTPDRSPEQAQEMIHAVHASLAHWLSVGGPVNHQRGLWLIARVYSELGNAVEALRYARLCADITERMSDTLQDFDIAYSYEALARAFAIGGDHAEAERQRSVATEQAQAITDPEARDLVLADIAAGHWGVLSDT